MKFMNKYNNNVKTERGKKIAPFPVKFDGIENQNMVRAQFQLLKL